MLQEIHLCKNTLIFPFIYSYTIECFDIILMNFLINFFSRSTRTKQRLPETDDENSGPPAAAKRTTRTKTKQLISESSEGSEEMDVNEVSIPILIIKKSLLRKRVQFIGMTYLLRRSIAIFCVQYYQYLHFTKIHLRDGRIWTN